MIGQPPWRLRSQTGVQALGVCGREGVGDHEPPACRKAAAEPGNVQTGIYLHRGSLLLRAMIRKGSGARSVLAAQPYADALAAAGGAHKEAAE